MQQTTEEIQIGKGILKQIDNHSPEILEHNSEEEIIQQVNNICKNMK